MRWVYTATDPLWIGCMRATYQRIVARAAAGSSRLGDERRLYVAMSGLGLLPSDYYHDLANPESDRMRGVWPNPLPLRIDTIDDDGLIEIPTP